MGLIHYDNAPAAGDAALVTASDTTPVAHVVAINRTALAATVSLSVVRSLSGVTETFAASQPMAPLSAAELVYDPGVALGEIVLSPGDTLNGSASGTGPAAPGFTKANSGGTVLTGTYGAKVTYVSAAGETVASAAATVTTTADISTLTVASPAANANATGWYAYSRRWAGRRTRGSRRRAVPTAIGTGLTLTAPPSSSGAQPPTVAGVTLVAFE